jgi:anti-sigma28 factor (negative regulator of flagellin synthesis)
VPIPILVMIEKDDPLSTDGRVNRGKDQGWTDFQGRKNTPLSLKEKTGGGRNEVMVMDIKRVSEVYQALAYEPKAAKDKKSAPVKAPEVKKEQVELSDSSKNLQKVKEAVDATPDIRIPIVEKILERIKNNDYPVNTHLDEAIDRMLKNKVL